MVGYAEKDMLGKRDCNMKCTQGGCTVNRIKSRRICKQTTQRSADRYKNSSKYIYVMAKWASYIFCKYWEIKAKNSLNDAK